MLGWGGFEHGLAPEVAQAFFSGSTFDQRKAAYIADQGNKWGGASASGSDLIRAVWSWLEASNPGSVVNQSGITNAIDYIVGPGWYTGALPGANPTARMYYQYYQDSTNRVITAADAAKLEYMLNTDIGGGPGNGIVDSSWCGAANWHWTKLVGAYLANARIQSLGQLQYPQEDPQYHCPPPFSYNGHSYVGGSSYDAVTLLRDYLEFEMDNMLRSGTEEDLSPSGYYSYQIHSIALLVDFAPDQRVKEKAKMLLDWLVFQQSVGYSAGHLAGGHGRHYDRPEWDGKDEFPMGILFNLNPNNMARWSTSADLYVSTYRPPVFENDFFESINPGARSEPDGYYRIIRGDDQAANNPQSHPERYRYDYITPLYNLGGTGLGTGWELNVASGGDKPLKVFFCDGVDMATDKACNSAEAYPGSGANLRYLLELGQNGSQHRNALFMSGNNAKIHEVLEGQSWDESSNEGGWEFRRKGNVGVAMRVSGTGALEIATLGVDYSDYVSFKSAVQSNAVLTSSSFKTSKGVTITSGYVDGTLPFNRLEVWEGHGPGNQPATDEIKSVTWSNNVMRVTKNGATCAYDFNAWSMSGSGCNAQITGGGSGGGSCGNPGDACTVGTCPGTCDASGNTCNKTNLQCGGGGGGGSAPNKPTLCYCPNGSCPAQCTALPPLPVCGNGQIEIGEECDGTNWNGQTCQTKGFTGGTLSCSACRFDISQCTTNQNQACTPNQSCMTSSNCSGMCNTQGTSCDDVPGDGCPVTVALCADGKDNDNDGKCDTSGSTCTDGSTPGDPGCLSSSDGSESDPPAAYCTPSGSCSIPLVFSEPPSYQYSFAAGVPFPRGSLPSLGAIRLETPSGQEVPAQYQSLALWPDGSQKSVLVVVSPSSISPSGYVLKSGTGVSRTSYTTNLAVTEDASSVTVRTGKIQFQVSKSRFAVFDQVWSDANANGQYESAEQLLSGPGDMFLVNAFDNAEYTSSRYSGPQVAVEERGPERAVIRANGKLQSASGATLTDFIVWLTAYADRDYVQMDYTLVDTRPEVNVMAARSQLALSVKSYGIRLPVFSSGKSYAFGGENGQTYQGLVTGEQYLYERGDMNYVDGYLQNPSYGMAYEGVGTGTKAPGWMDVGSGSGGVAVMLRDFWQQFPKELSVNPSTVTLSLHPSRASQSPDLSYPTLGVGGNLKYLRPNTFYFAREGGAKTYQMLFQFHAGTQAAVTTHAVNNSFQSSPLLQAPASWYTSSGVFGDIVQDGSWSAGYDDWVMSNMYVPNITQYEGAGGYTIPYGWRDFGDRMRYGWADVINGVRIPSFYNDTHVGGENFFTQYLRTLDRRWWDLGEMASRHWMDIDVSHTSRTGYWTDQFNTTVNFGPGEGYMQNHTNVDHETRNVHWGHEHVSGLPALYLLTGDQRSLQVLREHADWWVQAVPVFFPTPVPNPHWAEAERDYAWPLYTLNEAYRTTGDVKYLQAGSQVVKHLIGWWQTPFDHKVQGAVVGRTDASQGTGWWYMYPKEGNSSTGSECSGTNPWMAGALLSSLIDFTNLDQDYHLVDHTVVNEMMLQTMNYVVKYGWESSSKYFVYSECNRGTVGDLNHIIYPLAYLWNVERTQGSSHPQWYDTINSWISIAKAQYEDWKIIKGRPSATTGIYGYEMIYPSEFFSLMKQLEDQGLLQSVP